MSDIFLKHLKRNALFRSIRFQIYARFVALAAVFGVVLLFLPELDGGLAWASMFVLGILLALLLAHMLVATMVRSLALINAPQAGADRILETDIPAELQDLVRSYNVMSNQLATCQRELQDQLRRTALLTQLSIELHASLDPALLVGDILRAIVANTDAKHASIILAGPDGAIKVASTILGGQVSPIAPERARWVLDTGLAGWALRYGRNVTLGDAGRDARWVAFSDHDMVGSAMALPLTFNGETLGVLTITHPAQEQFTSKDLLLLAGVAAQAGIAISAAQRHIEEQRRHEQALLLFSMSQFLTAARSPVDLAAELLEKSGAVFEAYHSALFLADYTTAELGLFAARAGALATDAAPACDLSAPMAAAADRAWQNQATITEAVPAAAGAPDAELVCVAVPLLHNGVAIGAFVLVAPACGMAVFPARVWSLLTIFTNVAAVAFANRQLVDQLQLRADLLDQQVAERTIQLQHGYDLLRIVFDYLPDGLVLMDARGRILSANDAWCQGVLALRPQGAVGRQYAEIMQEVERGITLLVECPPSTAASGRVRCTTLDGRQRWYEIDRYVVTFGGADGFIERWRDVTLREALQRQLLLQEQLTSLGRLATSVVHEIGNPLQGVRSSLELCLEDPVLPSSAAEYLTLATGELERIVQTLDRLRELYHAPRLTWEVVDLNRLIVGAQEIITRQLGTHQIDLDFCLTPDLPPVYAQPDSLRQVFLNLILNAQAAMPRGGAIHVATTADSARRMSCFCVTDTGVGISAEQLKHIFEPFQSQNLKPGLGLYLSRLIVQQHHGDIVLTSTLGAGASVMVYIPWSEANNDTSNSIDS